ncbi:hypothetical protein TNCV_4899951 [Trichonephila clavipes]|nr:hypothetical protein TNCV_4899951 [Trichonephila clavipes]
MSQFRLPRISTWEAEYRSNPGSGCLRTAHKVGGRSPVRECSTFPPPFVQKGLALLSSLHDLSVWILVFSLNFRITEENSVCWFLATFSPVGKRMNISDNLSPTLSAIENS